MILASFGGGIVRRSVVNLDLFPNVVAIRDANRAIHGGALAAAVPIPHAATLSPLVFLPRSLVHAPPPSLSYRLVLLFPVDSSLGQLSHVEGAHLIIIVTAAATTTTSFLGPSQAELDLVANVQIVAVSFGELRVVEKEFHFAISTQDETELVKESVNNALFDWQVGSMILTASSVAVITGDTSTGVSSISVLMRATIVNVS
mmetsp:Transcript_31864/g.60927  ORF Transcript_31864/g.60927 Transcript_31864/m.60927 type:complete len:202 (+) Transcript_31864:2504-3109(+)